MCEQGDKCYPTSKQNITSQHMGCISNKKQKILQYNLNLKETLNFSICFHQLFEELSISYY